MYAYTTSNRGQPHSCQQLATGLQLAVRASYGSQLAPITCNAHVMWGPWSVDLVSNGGQREDKYVIQRSQPCQHGKFRYVSVSEWQRSRLCGQNHYGPFVRVVLATKAKVSARAMAADSKTKAMLSPPPSRVFLNSLVVTQRTKMSSWLHLCIPSTWIRPWRPRWWNSDGPGPTACRHSLIMAHNTVGRPILPPLASVVGTYPHAGSSLSPLLPSQLVVICTSSSSPAGYSAGSVCTFTLSGPRQPPPPPPPPPPMYWH